MESLEDSLDMFLVRGHVSGVDENVIQVYYNANVQKICKDSVYKALVRPKGMTSHL